MLTLRLACRSFLSPFSLASTAIVAARARPSCAPLELGSPRVISVDVLHCDALVTSGTLADSLCVFMARCRAQHLHGELMWMQMNFPFCNMIMPVPHETWRHTKVNRSGHICYGDEDPSLCFSVGL